jgi:peptide-methionine (S)-S-oxide reductase
MAKEVAVFGGGCFWCTEAVFKMLKGVTAVDSGYAGGTKPNPTYENVSSGQTGHAEVIRIEFDPSVIDYRKLLTVFFATHDPTTPNRQGADIGSQYRSIVLYETEAQKRSAEQYIAELNASSNTGAPIVTEVKPLSKFYPAEEYHRDYYAKNKGQAYCEVVINPKLKKAQKEFADLMREEYVA